MSKRFYIREKTFFGVGTTVDNPFKRTTRDFLGLDIADPELSENWCSAAADVPSRLRVGLNSNG